MSEEDSPPQPVRRCVRKFVVVSSSSSDTDSDSSPNPIALGVRRKRMRVLSDAEGSDLGVRRSRSNSPIIAPRKRNLRALRPSEVDSDSSGWSTDHSTTSPFKPSTTVGRSVSGFSSDSSEGNSEKCSICLQKFKDQEVGIPESCEHIFCIDCITEWSKNMNTCPVDRIVFNSITVKSSATGRVVRSDQVKVEERRPSMEILVIEDPTACEICGRTDDEERMLLCDGCDLGYHLQCLTPPLTEIPLEQWLCPNCDELLEVIHISELDDLFTDIADLDLPIMPRSAPLRQARSAARRSTRNNRSTSAVDEPSTSSGRTSRGRRSSGGTSASTSRQPAPGRGAAPRRRRQTTTTHRRRKRRAQTVIVEYEVEENGKFPVTRKVKRIKKKSRKRPRTAARRSHVRASVRAKLASMALERRAERSQVADAAPGVFELSVSRQRAGIPSLSLFGNPHQLDYFSEDEQDIGESSMGSSTAVAIRPTSSILNTYRQARRKMISIPSPPHASAAPDLLSSIMEDQTKLHSKNSVVSITVDGRVNIKLESRDRTRREDKSGPLGRSNETGKSDDGRVDVKKGEAATRKAPSYGAGRGSGWGGGYRGNYHRDHPTGNFSRALEHAAPPRAPPPRAPPDHHAPDLFLRRPPHYNNDDPYDRDQFDRRRPDQRPLRDHGLDQRPFHQGPDQRQFRDQMPDHRQFHTQDVDQRQFNRDIDQRPFRDQWPDQRPFRDQNLDQRPFRDQGHEQRALPPARLSAGPAWPPYQPHQRDPPPARHSFGFENPIDMRTQPAPQSEPERPLRPPPEPPSFQFGPAPEPERARSDDGSDPDLVIDTDKYDPTEPTNDDDDEEDAPVLAVTTELPPQDTGDADATISSVAEDAESPEIISVSGPPAVCMPAVPSAAAMTAAAARAGDVEDAVRAVLAEHRAMLAARHASDDDDSDGECPNFSIYSATSVHIAELPREPPPRTTLPPLAPPVSPPEPPPEDPTPTPTPPRDDPTPPPPIDEKERELIEKVSKRCPITTNPRNPIKIKLNTPSLIKRKIALYDEEDVADVDAGSETIDEPEPKEAAVESKTTDIMPEKIQRSPEKSSPKSAVENEKIGDNEMEKSESPTISFAAKATLYDDEDKDVGDAETDGTPTRDEAEFPSEVNGEVLSKKVDSEREDDDDHDDKHARTESQKSGTENQTDDEREDDDDSDKGSAKELQNGPTDENLEKMTESISETEDERSYTPCLDENKSKDTSLETDKDKGIEGLDTEMISEEEGNELFSDTERAQSPAQEADGEAPAEASAAPAEAKKKKKKESKPKEKKDKTKKKADVSFKKLSKTGKERNYRERDKEEKKGKKEKRAESPGAEERRQKRREKRKDLERYDVRTVLTERRRRKDAFGRDITPPGIARPLSPRLGSLSPRRRSISPRRRSMSPRRTISPHRRPISPRRRSISPHRRSISPRRRSISPRRRSISPRRRSISPRRRSISPRRRSISPRRRSMSPRRSVTPKRKTISPRRRPSVTGKRTKSPRRITPRRRSISLRKKSISPRRKSISPRRKSISPRRKSISPRRKSISPRLRKSVSPRGRKASPRRRRSASRGRKRARRSASKSPKPKAKKKKRAAARSAERPKSPRRKTPKKKRAKRVSPSPERAPPAAAPWSPPSVDSRLLSPCTPPPDSPPRRARPRRPRDPPHPSKEVFTSGDNILVSVSFKDDERDRLAAERRRRREAKRERRRRRRAQPAPEAASKPVAIIDLERSPFRELTPSPKNVIVLSDSDHGADEAAPPAPAAAEPEPPQFAVGPKTPPEPSAPPVKFTLAVKPAAARAPNALRDQEEPPAAPPAGPGTPPGSPDAYDPFEPTRSPSTSPAQPAAEPAPRSMTLEAAQKTNMSADDVIDRRPISPIEKVMALLQSTRDVSPEPPPQPTGGPPPEPPQPAPASAAPAPTAMPAPAAAAAPPVRIVLPSPTRSQQPKLFLAKPSPIKSNPVKPMQATKISRLPLPLPRRAPSADLSPGADSPYSPGSSDFGDLFSPPGAPPAPAKSSHATKRDMFDALFDTPPKTKKKKSSAAKVPVKLNKKKGKTQVGVKIDEDNLKILDDLPSSAVEMQVKSKFLKKLNRQERVVEEVKLVLKPHYNKKHVTKEEYKEILRRAVPKICHNKSGEINPTKIQALVEAYVKKYRKKHKLGLA